MRILIADDDPIVRGMLCRIAEMLGHSTLEASNGRDAAEDLSPAVDLLITDIVVSGDHGHRDRAIEGGAAFLSKPFVVTDLIAEINKVEEDIDR